MRDPGRSFGRALGRAVVVSAFAGQVILLTALTGCRGNQQPGVVAVDNNGPDPADANMAPVSDLSGAGQQSATGMVAQGSRRLLDEPQGSMLGAHVINASGQQVQSYPQISRLNAAPRAYPNESQSYPAAATPPLQNYPDQGSGDQGSTNRGYANQGYPEQGPTDQGTGEWSDGEQDAYNQVTEEAETAPPPLPVYEQPPAPAPNYLWTPGYWNYAPAGYYWVPGVWVAAPFTGALWTPGYWGAWNHHYGYHPGYWGRHIGFYGGVAYGYGYYGSGYHGGYWRGNDFYYNEAVNRVNVSNVRNVYNRTVVVNNNTVINNTMVNNRNVTLSRVSYNGGAAGIQARPAAAEIAAFRGPRVPAMTAQLQNQRAAAQSRQQFFQQNRGQPVLAAEARPVAADRVTAPAAVRTGFDTRRGGAANQTPFSQGVRPIQPLTQQPGQHVYGAHAARQAGDQGGIQPVQIQGAQREIEQQGRAQQTGAAQQWAVERQQQRSQGVLVEQQRTAQGNTLRQNQPAQQHNLPQDRVAEQQREQLRVQGVQQRSAAETVQQQRVAAEQQQRMQTGQQGFHQAAPDTARHPQQQVVDPRVAEGHAASQQLGQQQQLQQRTQEQQGRAPADQQRWQQQQQLGQQQQLQQRTQEQQGRAPADQQRWQQQQLGQQQQQGRAPADQQRGQEQQQQQQLHQRSVEQQGRVAAEQQQRAPQQVPQQQIQRSAPQGQWQQPRQEAAPRQENRQASHSDRHEGGRPR